MAKSTFGPGELEQLFHEGISRVADETHRAKILALALEYAGEPCAPDDEQQFAVFVGGPLYHAVEDLVGRDAAESMMSFFDPILSRWLVQSSSGAWRRRAEAAPARGQRPVVVVAVADQHAGAKLSAALAERGYLVHTVRDGKSALDRCREYLPRAMIIDAALPGPVDATKLCKLVRLALSNQAPPFVTLGEVEAPPSSGVTKTLPKGADGGQVVSAVTEVSTK